MYATKENKTRFLLGDLKKVILIFILVIPAVVGFAFTANAAVYRGFTPIRTAEEVAAGMPQGYLTFEEATSVMTANEVDPAIASTAHGGYVTTSTKCIVCHSAHRATGIPEGEPTNTNQYFLTSGGDACTTCHVAEGSQATSLLVEWGQPGGPHNSRGGCLACHRGGIHGGNGSEFQVMNMFLLGNLGDQQIRDEADLLALGPNSAFWVPPVLTGGVNMNPSASNAATVGNTWWYDGGASVNNGVRVGAPTQIGGLPGERPGQAALVNAAQYSAARSVATSYVCSQAGCHINTVMANMQWGVGFTREANGETKMVTAHSLPAIMRTNGAYNGNNLATLSACGPCHVGTMGGFPTDEAAVSRIVYGCDQCHDMIGVATNSTAWPHGNRNILVYEWVQSADGAHDQTRIETTVTAGNLWMYGGNIARIDNGQPFNPDNVAANRPGADAAFGQNLTFADLNWQVLQGVTSRTGVPGASSAHANPGFRGLTDGGCLKCHVPVDVASLDAMNASAGDALRHNYNPAAAIPRTGSQRLFLWR